MIVHQTITFETPQPKKVDLTKDLPILEAANALYSRLLRVELGM